MEMYNELAVKVCRKCGIAKYPENFPFRDSKSGKRRTECVDCRNTYIRMRYLERLGKFKREIRAEVRESDPKTCIRCGKLKPLSEFTFHNRNKGQHRNFCHDCEKAWIRDYHKSSHGKEKSKEWIGNNKKRIEEYIRIYKKDPQFKEKMKHYSRKNVLKSFGITQEDYDRMFQVQDGKCKICGSSQNGKKNFCVDHNHETGKVRGLLCHNCNVSVGLMKDDPSLLRQAAEYLETY